jgi:DNA-binding IclR family transcriptional regulator
MSGSSCGFVIAQHRSEMLRAMQEHPNYSLVELATCLGWIYSDGTPNKEVVHRTMQMLVKERMVVRRRKGHYSLTPKADDLLITLP